MRAFNVLQKFGQDAHIYLPGASVPVLGAELVTNGDFSNGLTGWASAGSAAIAADSGNLVVTANGVSSYPGATQTVSCVVGKTYTLSLMGYRGTTASPIAMYAVFGGGGATVASTQFNSTTTPANSTYTFVASGNGVLSITPHISGAPAGAGTAYFDNISVREITGYTSLMNGLTAGNYLDSAGTTPGTVDQPVGLVLDAAGSLGVELVTNGSGDTLTGWAAFGGSSIASESSVFKVVATSASGQGLSQTLSGLTVGSTYRVSGSGYLASGTGFAYIAVAGKFESNVSSINTSVSFTFVATTTTHTVQPYIGGSVSVGATAYFDNISVREVTGIAASQPTTASKPILRRGAVNLLTYSGDFSNAAWVKGLLTLGVNGGLIASTTLSIDKTLNQTGVAASASTNYTACARVKKGALDWCLISQFNQTSTGSRRYFNLANGAVGSGDNFNGALDAVPPTITDAGDGYWLIALAQSGVAGTTSLSVRIQPAVGDLGRAYSASDTTSAQIFVASAALFQGTYTAQQIQALGGIPLTTTAPASTALGPQYWQFDGSNDSLSLGGPLFQMADDHCVVAGFGATNIAGYPTIFAPAHSAGNGLVAWMYADANGSVSAKWNNDANAPAYASAGFGVLNSGAKAVGTAVKRGASVFTRCNSVAGSTQPAPVGVCTVASASIGGGFGMSVNGSIYPVIAIKGTVSDPDLLLLEKFVGQLSGVQI